MKKNPGRKERRNLENFNRRQEGKTKMRKHNGLKENQGIRKKSKGFTLIELVLTLAIIIIVIGIALPSFIGIRDNAQQAVHQTNVRMLEDVATIFALENPGTETIWCPHEGVEADADIEITETNLHDSWNHYIAKWPVNPMKTGSYVVEISEAGKITVSPGVE